MFWRFFFRFAAFVPAPGWPLGGSRPGEFYPAVAVELLVRDNLRGDCQLFDSRLPAVVE